MSVGKDAQDAAARRLRKEAELNAINNGVAIVPDSSNGHGVLLSAAIRDFLDEKRVQRKHKTHADYDTVLRYFQQSCSKQYLADLTRKDLLNFVQFCREELELSPRTVFNKFAPVVAFLKTHKNQTSRARGTLRGSLRRDRRVTRKMIWKSSSQRALRRNDCGSSSS